MKIKRWLWRRLGVPPLDLLLEWMEVHGLIALYGGDKPPKED